MAYYNKIGLLILNSDSTKFLVCEPGQGYGTDVGDLEASKMKQYIMPGGQLDKGFSEIETLIEEIREELACELDQNSLEKVSDYTDIAAASPDRDVLIRLYQGDIIGNPKPSTEIGALHWIGKADLENPMISPIIRNKIIPDLIQKNILK